MHIKLGIVLHGLHATIKTQLFKGVDMSFVLRGIDNKLDIYCYSEPYSQQTAAIAMRAHQNWYTALHNQ